MENFVTKLCEAICSVYGWALLLMMSVVDFIAGYKVVILIAFSAVIIDAVWGIASAIKRKQFALSELARDSLPKLTVYGSCLLMFMLVDRLMLEMEITTRVVCACIVLVEAWSATASMIICFPKLPFLRILRKALAGEIARKLNCDPTDVESILNSRYENY